MGSGRGLESTKWAPDGRGANNFLAMVCCRQQTESQQVARERQCCKQRKCWLPAAASEVLWSHAEHCKSQHNALQSAMA